MEHFCLLTVENKLLSSKKEVTVNLGDDDMLSKYDSELIAATQRVTECSSLIGALNYLGSLGWELAHITPVRIIGGTSNGTEEKYLMKRRY
ncbi:hypothetical protein GWR56_17990 [Mucilaginibacter sp. 14171R-50]|uniref:hypothetical protein n=1 Tax=Mucilaginibacter sp. 14171R-50 TaxID=2703789 RepID=UPI00138C2628|nr:hypothetical protein [Mucilaginibacter sp. 14171R-50]QHS57338.1 hypothetical protein GWR56_17990 [Mucilaginibacter sp. 14171R-50]